MSTNHRTKPVTHLFIGVIALLLLLPATAPAAQGDFVWEYPSDYSTVTTPAVVDGKVYMGVSIDFMRLHAGTGAKEDQYTANVFTWASPAVTGGRVYFGGMNNQTLYCLDATNLDPPLWTWKDPINFTASLSSPPAVSGDYVYISSTYPPYRVFCLDTTSSGGEMWQFEHGLQNKCPVVSGDRVYVAGKNAGGDYVYFCLNAATGAKEWESEKISVIGSVPAVAGGYLYGGGYYLTCIDTATGVRVWQSSKTGLDSPPSVAGGKVYISGNKTVYCFSAKTGRVIWQYTSDSVLDGSQPAPTGNHLYIGAYSPDKLICLNAWTGDLVFEYATDDTVRTPSVEGGYVYFGTGDGGTSAISGVFCVQAADGDGGSWPMRGRDPGRSSALGSVASACTDTDGDGYSPDGGDCGQVDCADDDDERSPGHDEVCGDGIDNNCDGQTDEGCSSTTTTAAATTTSSVAATSTTTTAGSGTSTTTTASESTTTTTAGPGPCAVETVYGKKAPQTETLRRFRDRVLSRSAPGRAVIRLYYALSPAAADLLRAKPAVGDALRTAAGWLPAQKNNGAD